MRVLGLISGTSHDGIDAALVDFAYADGTLSAVMLDETSTPYSQGLRGRLVAALPPSVTTAAELAKLDVLIAEEFAAAASSTIGRHGAVDLVVSHGQTVFHWVEGAHARGSLQIGQPAIIAETVGSPVLGDIRVRDIAAGGHGAPLVSVLDELLLRERPGRHGALNLGGIANITVVEDGSIARAYDIGPANALIDATIKEHDLHPAGFDQDGVIARAGAVDDELLRVLLLEPYYRLPAPKSTGKELFHGDYITRALTSAQSTLSPADLVATLTELTIATVTAAVRDERLSSLLVSGGGCRNVVIMDGIRNGLPGVAVESTESIGLPADAKEAFAFALIGWMSWHGLPASVPAATGARSARLLGSLTPGTGPLVLPEPLRSAPRLLRMKARDLS